MKPHSNTTRRGFLKLAGVGFGAVSLRSLPNPMSLPDYPEGERLGRVTWWGSPLKTAPDLNSSTIRELAEDDIFIWNREVVGFHPWEINQRWVDTPDGYIWAPHLQMVANRANTPLESLPGSSLGPGIWAEVSVPFVDLVLDNPPARAPWLQYRIENGLSARLYYSQIVWIDDLREDEAGVVWYRVNERWGYGDIFWADGRAFRPISPEDVSPIRPEAENKRILVDVPHQSISCYEGEREVYYARVSTGALYNASGERVDSWATPAGEHPIWRKMVSLHMSGGTTGGGWDLPGIGWTTLFVGTGVAIHSTFWHNNFGVPMSRGCVNARPEDARWIFRWSLPHVAYDPGDVTVPLPGGTIVQVVES